MIVTITMNPAVDKSTRTDKLVPEKKIRCTELIEEGGGGGINISKALKELGTESLAIFPSGGSNGQTVEQYLKARGVQYRTIPTIGETRESITVHETDTNHQYRFVLPGAAISATEMEACFRALEEVYPKPEIVATSGSLPAGIPENFFARLAGYCNSKGIRCIIDTSGIPLQLAMQAGIYLIKPNLAELCSLVGKEWLEDEEVEDAARSLIEKGACEAIAVSMGPSGAMLVTRDQAEKVRAPEVRKLTTVGAGDSMVAGMIWMLQKGGSTAEMMRFGVACGSAATMNSGSELFRKDDVFRLYEQINLDAASG